MAIRKYLKGPQLQSSPAMVREAVNISSTDWTPTRAPMFRGIWVSATGNVTILDADGVSTTTNNVPVGLWAIGGITVVKSTTTATVDWAALDV